mgnify:CR=1 FL=1|jgi:uncharacterized membrane protein
MTIKRKSKQENELSSLDFFLFYHRMFVLISVSIIIIVIIIPVSIVLPFLLVVLPLLVVLVMLIFISGAKIDKKTENKKGKTINQRMIFPKSIWGDSQTY